MKNLFLTLSILLSFAPTFSQNTTAKLIDKNTKSPIPFATIQTSPSRGVISNEEGYFSLNLEVGNLNTITISCMGYQSKTLTIETLKASDFIIALETSINQLNEVYISNKKPNADDIIAQVRMKISDNYDFKLNKYNVFCRATDYVDFESLDFEIEKASHVSTKNLNQVNYSLDSLSKHIIASKIIHFSDFMGELTQMNKDSTKLVVSKATKLIDHKNDFSIDNVQEKAQALMLKYLDTTKTYKVKTGIFKVEDSLSFTDGEFKETKKPEYSIPNLKHSTSALLKNSQYYDGSLLYAILNPDLYTYTFEDVSYYNEDVTYVIKYEPKKSKAKYTGRIFVSSDTYAVTKLDYSYYESRHGSKVNLKLLLGVKYIENLSEGTILYKKNSESKYHPRYIKQTEGSYFYVSRGLKFIENSGDKNKVGIDFKIEGDNQSKREILFTSNNKISINDFNRIAQAKTVPYQMLKKFENAIWNNEETLEPLEEMKGFGGE